MMFREQFSDFLPSEVITLFDRHSPGGSGQEDVFDSRQIACMTEHPSANSISQPCRGRLGQLVHIKKRARIVVCENEYSIISFYNYKN